MSVDKTERTTSDKTTTNEKDEKIVFSSTSQGRKNSGFRNNSNNNSARVEQMVIVEPITTNATTTFTHGNSCVCNGNNHGGSNCPLPSISAYLNTPAGMLMKNFPEGNENDAAITGSISTDHGRQQFVRDDTSHHLDENELRRVLGFLDLANTPMEDHNSVGKVVTPSSGVGERECPGMGADLGGGNCNSGGASVSSEGNNNVSSTHLSGHDREDEDMTNHNNVVTQILGACL